MKKLMVMIGAVAAAFGLRADVGVINSSIGFEIGDPGCEELGPLDITQPGDDGVLWSSADANGEYIVTAYKEGEGLTGTGDNYLKITSEEKVPLYRTLTEVTDPLTLVDAGALEVTVDTKVKFTAFDTIPDATGKIMLWAKEEEVDGSDDPVYNLYVTANSFVGEPVNLLVKKGIDIEAWHTVKIVSVGKIFTADREEDKDTLGFAVEFDGVKIANTDEVADSDALLESIQEAYVKGEKVYVFPSMEQNVVNLTAVGFQGMGSIDNLTIAATEVSAEVDVTGLPDNAEANPARALPGEMITVTYTAAKGKLFKNGQPKMTATGTLQTDGTVAFETEPNTEEQDAKAAIGTKLFLTLNAALEAAKAEDTVTLLAGVENIGTTLHLATGTDLVLDLNGQTIVQNSNFYAIDLANGAKLTINDSSEGKTGALTFEATKFVNTYPTSMIRNKGLLTINGGTFTTDYTAVKNDEDPGVGELVINGGTFNIVDNENGYAGLKFAIMNWGVATINGGTFNGDVQALSSEENAASKASDLTINAGTLVPPNVQYRPYDANYSPVVKIAKTLEVAVVDNTPAAWNKKMVSTEGEVYVSYQTANLEVYTIDFMVDGVAVFTTNVFENTTPVYLGETPTKANGYTFSGWDKEIVAATADATYTAQFTDNYPAPRTLVWDSTYKEYGAKGTTLAIVEGTEDVLREITSQDTLVVTGGHESFYANECPARKYVMKDGEVTVGHAGEEGQNFPNGSVVTVAENATLILRRWDKGESVTGGGAYKVNVNGVTFNGPGLVKIVDLGTDAGSFKALNGTIDGNATFEIANVPSTAVLGKLKVADTWTGTVKLALNGNVEPLDLNAFGNAQSKVVLNKIVGGYVTQTGTANATVEIAGTVVFNNGYQNDTYTFTTLTGAGTLSLSKATTGARQSYVINTLDGFTGTITPTYAKLVLKTVKTSLVAVPETETVIVNLGTGSELENVNVENIAVKLANGDDITADVDVAVTVAGVTVVKKSAPAPVEPVDPEEPKTYDDATAAQAAADAINANKAEMIKAPAGVTDVAAYAANFEAVVSGTTVTVQLTATAEAALQTQVNGDVATVAEALVNATATEVAVTTTPGFYYTVMGGTDVSAITTAGTKTLATTTSTTLPKPTLDATTKAFYQIKVEVK